MTIVSRLFRPVITLFGRLHKWFMLRVYLPMIRQSQDINKINVVLSHADFRETRLILNAMNARIDPTAYIETHLQIHNAKPDYHNLSVGANCYIGKDCFIDLADAVTLQDRVTVAMRVTILTHFDAGQSAVREHYPRSVAPVMLCRDAYIGAGATILPGVTVHANAMVMAGAVVTQDVPMRTMVGGVPARVVKQLLQ